MTTLTNDELSELCGRPVDREFRLELIKEAEETGEPLAKVADKYSLPPLFIPDADGYFEHNGERFTKETFAARWPFRRFVYITTRKDE